MRSFTFPANFSSAEEGGFVITFADVPEVVTQAETVEQGIEEAADALEEAITGRINTGDFIPEPSAIRPGQYLIPVPMQSAMKAALYEEIRAQGKNKVQMAAHLGIDEKEIRRLLDPHYPSKLPRIAEILERVGKRVIVSVGDDEEFATHA